jgi:hypothetical protein
MTPAQAQERAREWVFAALGSVSMDWMVADLAALILSTHNEAVEACALVAAREHFNSRIATAIRQQKVTP